MIQEEEPGVAALWAEPLSRGEGGSGGATIRHDAANRPRG